MDEAEKSKTAIAIGNFDGFHLGHQKIVSTLSGIAGRKKVRSLVLTFAPNPKIFFRKEERLIVSDPEKRKLIKAMGVDRVVFLDFRKYRQMKGEAFVEDVLMGQYLMAHVVVGENFKFGTGQENDAGTLKILSRRFRFGITVVKPVRLDGRVISSTLIRKNLSEGKVTLANRMLGRMYFVDGVVDRGARIGREMGFPTINIKSENVILPGGVFETLVKIGTRTHQAVTNIGIRPTFGGREREIESHILNFKGVVYGKRVRLLFKKKIRDEIKFNSREELIRQIKKDIDTVTVDKVSHF